MKGAAWCWTLLVAAMVAGVAQRFVNRDRKPYWHDETFTSMQLAGYREIGIRLAFPRGRDVTRADLAAEPLGFRDAFVY